MEETQKQARLAAFRTRHKLTPLSLLARLTSSTLALQRREKIASQNPVKEEEASPLHCGQRF